MLVYIQKNALHACNYNVVGVRVEYSKNQIIIAIEGVSIGDLVEVIAIMIRPKLISKILKEFDISARNLLTEIYYKISC